MKPYTTSPRNVLVNVYENDYVRTHVKAPRGRGAWTFSIDGTLVTFTGTYTQSRKAAVTKAKELFAAQGVQFSQIILQA